MSLLQNRAVGHFEECCENCSGGSEYLLTELTLSPLGLILENLLPISCMVKL